MKRIKLRTLAMALLLAIVVLATSLGSVAQEKKPNIIFIIIAVPIN